MRPFLRLHAGMNDGICFGLLIHTMIVDFMMD
jgi:hypothetical protein